MEEKRIAVYSGSFNPLHIGHLAILKYLTGDSRFCKVHLIVSPKNPLKDGISSSSGQERYKAACEAVARHFPEGSVVVDDIELRMPEPHYTIKTLDALQAREVTGKFIFVMGSDNLADIRRWKDYPRILTDYGVAVYPRQGYDMETAKSDLLKENPAYHIDTLDADMVDISSTAIREGIAAGRDMSEWLM